MVALTTNAMIRFAYKELTKHGSEYDLKETLPRRATKAP